MTCQEKRKHQCLTGPLINTVSSRLVKNDETQGARILRNEAYIEYAAMTRDAAQRSRSRFSTACYERKSIALHSQAVSKPKVRDVNYLRNIYTM